LIGFLNPRSAANTGGSLRLGEAALHAICSNEVPADLVSEKKKNTWSLPIVAGFRADLSSRIFTQRADVAAATPFWRRKRAGLSSASSQYRSMTSSGGQIRLCRHEGRSSTRTFIHRSDSRCLDVVRQQLLLQLSLPLRAFSFSIKIVLLARLRIRILHTALIESRALLCKTVQVRSLRDGIPVAGQPIGTHLIGHKQDKVLLPATHSASPCRTNLLLRRWLLDITRTSDATQKARTAQR
jgi:hypothetical protein